MSVADATPMCEHRAILATMNISRASDLWLGELERSGHSDRTTGTYRRLLDKFADSHPRHTDVDDLTVHDVRVFLDGQARRQDGKRKAPATVAQNVSIISGFFDWLTKEGVVRRNPTRRNDDRIVSRPRQVRPEENDNVVTVSTDGVVKLLAAANQSGWPERLAVNCLAYLGPRRRALAQLKVSDYDAAGRMLTFREKGGSTIEKPVPHELAQLIEAAIVAGVYETADDYLVPSRAQQRRQGSRDDRIIWRLIRDVAAQAGVTTHVHALRAAFAVHFLETHGGELVALQKLMGHKRIETTLVYLRRLDRRQQMEAVRDLSWDTPIPPQFAEKPLEANGVTEKEGFEPSSQANPDGEGAGSQRALPDALMQRIQTLRDASEVRA